MAAIPTSQFVIDFLLHNTDLTEQQVRKAIKNHDEAAEPHPPGTAFCLLCFTRDAEKKFGASFPAIPRVRKA